MGLIGKNKPNIIRTFVLYYCMQRTKNYLPQEGDHNMVAEIGYKILMWLILTSNRLAWKIADAWAKKNDYYLIPRDG